MWNVPGFLWGVYLGGDLQDWRGQPCSALLDLSKLLTTGVYNPMTSVLRCPVLHGFVNTRCCQTSFLPVWRMWSGIALAADLQSPITPEAEHTITRLPGLLYVVRSSSNAAFYNQSIGQSAEPSCFGMGLHVTSLDMWQVCVFPHFWFFNNFPVQEAHGDFGWWGRWTSWCIPGKDSPKAGGGGGLLYPPPSSPLQAHWGPLTKLVSGSCTLSSYFRNPSFWLKLISSKAF